jgi:tetratricopeptide (TPR) repeat protein
VDFDTAWLAPSGILDDRYEIRRVLGHGGAAVVLLALDRRYDREVAIKVLKPELAGVVASERFLQEVRITASLQHPHILPLLDSGESRGLPYYITPYVSGGSLRDRLEEARQLPLDEALGIAADVAAALQCAHEHQILHRDIKPENILLANGHAIVADFGLAQALVRAGGDRLTASGIVVGTPAYISPEQASGERVLGPTTDVYSLACVIYEMIAGVPPFVGPTAESVIAQRFRGTPHPLRDYRPTVPAAVDVAVSRAMCSAPADRFQSARDFATSLGVARTPSPVKPFPATARYRAPARRAAIIAVGVVLLAIASVLFARAEVLTSAKRSIERGATALSVGDVGSAVTLYRRAVRTEPQNALAQLGLAEALLLDGSDTTSEWRSSVRLAVAGEGSLSSPDRDRARALAALADQQYGQASNLFRALRARDARDISAAVGLALSIRWDSAVVEDRSSPSGWHFRGSYDEALRTYRSVLDAFPTAQRLRRALFPRLVQLIKPEWGSYRAGVALNDHTVRFGGWPTLERDSLGERVVFVPYLLRDLAVGGSGTAGLRNTADAIEQERQQLRDVAQTWTQEFPSEPNAHAALGRALELLGNISPPRPGESSALGEVRAARQITADAHVRLSLMRDEVRLLIKTLDFARAAALADSILAVITPVSVGDRWALATLAVLTGEMQQAVTLVRPTAESATFLLPNGSVYRPEPDLAAAAYSFFVFASVGAPTDSIRSSLRLFDQLLERRVAPGRRDSIRAGMIGRTLSLAAPILGPEAVQGLPARTTTLVAPWQALGRGDRRAVRLMLDSLDLLRRSRFPGALHIDEAYQESLLRLAIADTVGAVRQLDGSLGALPTAGTSVLTEMPEAGALVRAMSLRSALSERLGDTATAQRWRSAVSILRRQADPSILRNQKPEPSR